MNQEITPFEAIRSTNPTGNEFWSSRDFAKVLGYADYWNFQSVIDRQWCARELTPHTAFYRAILESVVEMEGSAKTRLVLDRVGEKMKGVLKPIDYAVLPSDGKSIRWRNAAQWARNTPVNEDGRMTKTKNGIWEISDKGRKWLKGKN